MLGCGEVGEYQRKQMIVKRNKKTTESVAAVVDREKYLKWVSVQL